MTAEMTHRTFFGDAERDFRLTPELVVELERKTDAGIGALSRRLFNREFKRADMIETIRLALIGGGTSPKEADALVSAYVAQAPLIQNVTLAIAILETLWFGAPKKDEDNGQA